MKPGQEGHPNFPIIVAAAFNNRELPLGGARADWRQ
jgi:hypothetical protein